MIKDEVVKFRNLVGDKKDIVITMDNLRNFHTEDTNGIVVFDDASSIFYSLRRNVQNNQNDLPVELIKCRYEDIQFLTAYLTKDESIKVIEELKSLMDSDTDIQRAYNILAHSGGDTITMTSGDSKTPDKIGSYDYDNKSKSE